MLGGLARTRAAGAHLPGPGLEMLEILGAGNLGDGMRLLDFVDFDPQLLDFPTQPLLAQTRMQDEAGEPRKDVHGADEARVERDDGAGAPIFRVDQLQDADYLPTAVQERARQDGNRPISEGGIE